MTRDGVKVVELATQRTSVSELATATLLHRPGAAGDVVRALLAGSATQEVGGVQPDDVASAGALLADGPVTVVLGRPNVAESADGVVAAAAAIHAAHPDVRFLSALRRGNVHGALDMGLAPGLLPGRVTLDEAGDWFEQHGWPKVPTEVGLDATGILQAAAGGKIDVLVLLGADPLADFPDTELAARAVAGARTVIAVDRFLTASAQQADVVLAASGPAETDGTTTNLEGRISPVARKITPPGTARDDWMLAAELSRLLGTDLRLESADQILAEITAVAPSHAGLTVDAIHGARDGVIVGGPPPTSRWPIRPTPASLPRRGRRPSPPRPPTPRPSSRPPRRRPPRPRRTPSPPRSRRPSTPPAPSAPPLVAFRAPSIDDSPAVDAYSLRLVANRQAVRPRHRCPALTRARRRSPSDTVLRLHPHDFDRLGVAAGTVVTATSSKGSVSLPVQPDDRIGRGAAVVTLHQPGPTVGALIDATARVTEIRCGEAVMRPSILGLDPLLTGDIGLEEVLIVLLKVVITFALLLVAVMFMIWFERKVHADMSNRLGPNRAGPFGILQTLADGIKFFFKEDLLPDRADKRVFILAPFLSLVPAFLVFSVIPIGGEFTDEQQGAVEIFGHDTWLQLADPPDRRAAHPRLLLDRRVRRDAGGLVVRLEVPAARLGAGVGADGVLRSGARPLRGGRGDAGRLAVDPRHRDDARPATGGAG